MTGTIWRHQSGSTDELALDLAFRDDPDLDVPFDEDLRASWGSFALWAGGRNLCAHAVQGEVLEHTHWYLLPLLEWLVGSWERLLHEERLPESRVAATTAAEYARLSSAQPLFDDEADWGRLAAEQDWMDAHRLRSAAEGGLFPDVYLRRWGDQLEVSAGAEHGPGWPVGLAYLATGTSVRVPVAGAARALHEVVTLAVEDLQSRRPESDRVTALATSVARLAETSRQRRTVRFHLLAGWRGSATRELFEDTTWRALDEALVASTAPAAALLFGGFSPTISAGDVERLTAVLARAAPAGTTAVDGFAAELDAEQESLLGRPAGERGGELGERFLDLVGDVPAKPGPIDIEALVARLGVTVERVALDDAEVRGLSVLAGQRAPLLVVNTAYARGPADRVQRFTMAHELAHLLLDRGRSAELAIASGPWAPRAVEQRANGFAAAVLMPAELLRSIVRELEAPLDPALLRAAARQLRVSAASLLDRLLNVGLLSPFDRDRIQEEFAG